MAGKTERQLFEAGFLAGYAHAVTDQKANGRFDFAPNGIEEGWQNYQLREAKAAAAGFDPAKRPTAAEQSRMALRAGDAIMAALRAVLKKAKAAKAAGKL